jgi:hypothetical protein
VDQVVGDVDACESLPEGFPVQRIPDEQLDVPAGARLDLAGIPDEEAQARGSVGEKLRLKPSSDISGGAGQENVDLRTSSNSRSLYPL